LLPPGTVVGNAAPPGWTDLVIKSIPRLASGDLETLPATARTTASLFRTVFVADVRNSPGASGAYSLKRLGLGLCVPVDGVDTVVTPDGPPRVLGSLGFVERNVLAVAQDEIKKGRVLARTADFALFASPGVQKIGPEHVPVTLLYALLVDPSTGRLRSLIWSILSEPASRRDPDEAVLLMRGLVDQCALDVAAERLLGAIPYHWSFAMRSLPTGRRIDLPAGVKRWAVDPGRIAADPETFARRLRELLAGARVP
jgi:hypothetical protein